MFESRVHVNVDFLGISREEFAATAKELDDILIPYGDRRYIDSTTWSNEAGDEHNYWCRGDVGQDESELRRRMREMKEKILAKWPDVDDERAENADGTVQMFEWGMTVLEEF